MSNLSASRPGNTGGRMPAASGVYVRIYTSSGYVGSAVDLAARDADHRSGQNPTTSGHEQRLTRVEWERTSGIEAAQTRERAIYDHWHTLYPGIRLLNQQRP